MLYVEKDKICPSHFQGTEIEIRGAVTTMETQMTASLQIRANSRIFTLRPCVQSGTLHERAERE